MVLLFLDPLSISCVDVLVLVSDKIICVDIGFFIRKRFYFVGDRVFLVIACELERSQDPCLPSEE